MRVLKTARAAVSTDLQHRGRNYRPAIDGYRGLFIVLVVAYHFGATALAGGWIGINHFFVFSGFLIGKLLIKERERTGRIDFVRFYLRRARRILPALAILVAAVLIRVVLVPGQHRPQTAGDSFAAMTFWLNWRLIARNDQYFDLFDEPSPLRHVWTLSVEEQFYVLIPIIILMLYIVARRQWMRVALVAAAACGSALWTAHLVGTPTATFSRLYYGTDIRAQALLVGVAAAFVHTKVRGGRPFRISRLTANLFGWVGTIASLTAFFLLGSSSVGVFRYGGLLAFAVLAAMMGASALDPRDLLINKVMGNRVLVHLGQISYGIYLYHWPIGLWLPMPGLPRVLSGTLQFGITWVCAVLSYRLVEMPVMAHGVRGLVRPLRFVGPGVVAFLAVAALVVQQAVPAAAASMWNGAALSPAVRYVPPRTQLKVAIVGDSIPASIADGFKGSSYPGLDLLRHAEYAGCDFVPVTLAVGDRLIPEDAHCPGWRSTWPKSVRKEGAQVVLAPAGLAFTLPQQIDGKVAPLRSPQVRTALTASLDALLAAFRSSGARQLDIINVPCRVLRPGSLPVSAQQQIGTAAIPLDTTWVNAIIATWVREHAASGARLVDLDGQLCRGGYRARINNAQLYQDGIHFTVTGAALVWSWLAPTVVNTWQQDR